NRSSGLAKPLLTLASGSPGATSSAVGSSMLFPRWSVAGYRSRHLRERGIEGARGRRVGALVVGGHLVHGRAAGVGQLAQVRQQRVQGVDEVAVSGRDHSHQTLLVHAEVAVLMHVAFGKVRGSVVVAQLLSVGPQRLRFDLEAHAGVILSTTTAVTASSTTATTTNSRQRRHSILIAAGSVVRCSRKPSRTATTNATPGRNSSGQATNGNRWPVAAATP